MNKVSVIIAARNEIYLEKTIRDILSNAEGEIEVLVMLDGWVPEPRIVIDDTRVIFYHYPKSIGQRQCINAGARLAKGKYIMKLDAHCAVDKGFDVKLAADCEYDWTVIPRMYNLDVETWKPKLRKRTDYMYITSPTHEKPFRAMYYGRLPKPSSNRLIDDTMCNMGPGWFMHKDRYWELGGLDEGHGGWGQMGIEVSLKAWLSGGRLVVNKKTWFSHWFRGGGGPGFPYSLSGRAVDRARKYSQDLWLNNKWDKATRTLQWLVDKFNPSGWEKGESVGKKEDLAKKANSVIRRTFKVRTAYDFPPHGAKYNGGNRLTLLDAFAKLDYKEGVEIGVQKGIFSEQMLLRVPNLHLTCIDPWVVYNLSHITHSNHKRNYEITLKRLKAWINNGQCTILRKKSEAATGDFKDGSLDFVYIDGAHDFDSVCIDIIKWYPKIKVGGVMSLHDYYNSKRNGIIDVVNGYTKCHKITPWFVTYELMPTAFWVKEDSPY